MGQQVAKRAQTPAALTNPGPLLEATKKLGEAQVDLVKADLAHRIAYIKLAALIGKE